MLWVARIGKRVVGIVHLDRKCFADFLHVGFESSHSGRRNPLVLLPEDSEHRGVEGFQLFQVGLRRSIIHDARHDTLPSHDRRLE